MRMSKSIDRLTLLTSFIRIAERGSISAAARDLELTQATVSRHLSELEERLGRSLVHRTTHSLALTEAGQTVLAEARGLLAGWEGLTDRLHQDDDRLGGPLKVVAPVALGQLHLIEAALQFQQSHPAVQISWIMDDAPIRFAEVGCDLWIKIGQPSDDRLVVKEVAQVERLIVLAPALVQHRTPLKRPTDLHSLPCVALEPFEGGVIPLKNSVGSEARIRADVVLTTNNIFAAHQAAVMALGYAVMPRWLVAEDLRAGRLLDVLPDWRAPTLSITMSHLPTVEQTRLRRAFAAHMRAAIVEAV